MKKLLLLASVALSLNAFAQKDIKAQSISAPSIIYRGEPASITVVALNTKNVQITPNDSIYYALAINGQYITNGSSVIVYKMPASTLDSGQTVTNTTTLNLNFGQNVENATLTAVMIMTSGSDIDDDSTNNSTSTTTSLHMSHPAGIESVNGSVAVKVYPNPAKDVLHIDVDYSKEKVMTMYDITGKKVSETRFTETKFDMNVQDLNRGVYLYEIKTSQNEVIKTGKVNVN